MAVADDGSASPQELTSREPTVEDLRDLCRELNQRGARYVVIGGFAIMAARYNRRTMDVDGDLVFLRHWFAERGVVPPQT